MDDKTRIETLEEIVKELLPYVEELRDLRDVQARTNPAVAEGARIMTRALDRAKSFWQFGRIGSIRSICC